MQDLNRVVLIGRLAKDGELKQMSSGSSRLDFSVAFNTTKKNGNEYQDEGNFVNLSYWGKIAEVIAPRMKKGTQVAIEGHLKQDKWEKDGQKHYDLRLIPETVQIMSSKAAKQDNEPGEQQFPEDMPF